MADEPEKKLEVAPPPPPEDPPAAAQKVPPAPLPPIDRPLRAPADDAPPPPEEKPSKPTPENEVHAAVIEYVYSPAHRAVSINQAVAKAVFDAGPEVDKDKLEERVMVAAAAAKARWATPEENKKREQRVAEMVEGLHKRLKAAENPAREAVIIESELYEAEKSVQMQTVATAMIAEIERGLQPLKHAEKGSAEEILSNARADELLNNVMMLRREVEGSEEIADCYEQTIREHKAVPTAEDQMRLEELKAREMRRKAMDKDGSIRAEVAPALQEAFASVSPDALGEFAAPLRAAGVKMETGKASLFTAV